MYKIVMTTEDKQVGKNLLWLLEKIFPDCKINYDIGAEEDRPDAQQLKNPDVMNTESKNRSIPG